MRKLLLPFLLVGAGLSGCVEENYGPLPEGGGGSHPSTSTGCGETECDGACVDLASDPLNCGACGHDCFGGACEAGQCQPVVLVTGEVGVDVLVVDETHLYWGYNAQENGIRRAKIDGTEKETLSTTSNAQPYRMVVDGTHLYWTRRQGAHTVMRMPKNGGAESKLADGMFPTGIAVDSEFVYWANYWDGVDCLTGEIRKVPLAGGASTVVSAGENCPNSVVTGGGRIIWSDEDVDNNVGRIRAWSESGVITLATQQNRPSSLTTDGTFVYWPLPLEGTVARAAFEGGSPEILAQAEAAPSAIMRSGDVLYWMVETSSDPMMPRKAIRSMPTTSGEVKTVYDLGVSADAIQDSTSFYWGDPQTGEIKRLAKSLP